MKVTLATNPVVPFLDGFISLTEGKPSIFKFIKDQGRAWAPGKLPKGVKAGKMKECFKNAFDLARCNPGYIYVEGYANRIIPCLHAWCLKDGVVVDPTWNPAGNDYYGIPFDIDFVTRTVVENGVYGLLGQPETVATLFKLPRNKYIAKEFA